MSQRSVAEIMEEGRTLTLEWGELKRRKIVGGLNEQENARLLELDGYLLGLMGQAMAMGVGVQASEYNEDTYDTYGIDGYDENGYDADGYDRNGYNDNGYDAKGYDAEGYDVDGYDRDGYDEYGYNEDGFLREEVEEQREAVAEAQNSEKDKGGIFNRFW